MIKNSGSISLSRKIQDHWIWDDPNKLKWWLDILLTVNYKKVEVNLGYEVFTCDRGESLMSISTWAARWKVSKDTARNFLDMLVRNKMILRVSIGKTTRITVCNYDSYQVGLHVNSPQSTRNPSATPTQLNKDNKDIKIKDISEPSVSDGIYPKCMEMYNAFILDKTGSGAKLNSATGAALNKIIAYLKTQCKDKENLPIAVPEVFSKILSNYDSWDKFHQGQLNLNQIESNLINIMNAIRNKKVASKNTIVKEVYTEAPNRKIA